MKKIIASLAVVGIFAGSVMAVTAPPAPGVSYSYKITPDGHAQIIQTVTQSNGAFTENASPPLGKAQLTAQAMNIGVQQTALSGQVAATNAALSDSGLTK